MAVINFNIKTLFAQVIDNLRQTGDVLTLVDNTNNTYTLTTAETFTLAANDIIEFDDVAGFTSKYIVTNVVNDTSITFSATSGTAIPSLATAIWLNSNPTFMYGFPDNTNERTKLASPNKPINYKNTPLIVLAEPISRTITPNQAGLYFQGYVNFTYSDVNMIFCLPVPAEYTSNWNAPKYETDIYTPMLQLAFDFFEELQKINKENNYTIAFGDATFTDFSKINGYDLLLGGVNLRFSMTAQNGVTICLT